MNLRYEWEIHKIAKGEKTQITRKRTAAFPVTADDHIVAVCSTSGRQLYGVGRDYCIQDYHGSTKYLWWPGTIFAPAPDDTPLPDRQWWVPLRVRITTIRDMDVRDFSEADAQAEGYANLFEFWSEWCQRYDPVALEKTPESHDELWDAIISRFDENYAAWVLTIEPVGRE